MVSSICFEPEGSSSGRWLYMLLWYGVFSMHRYQHSNSSRWNGIKRTVLPTRLLTKHTILYHNRIYTSLPEDEPLGSKHVGDIKIKRNYIINLESAHFVGLYCIRN